MFIRTMSKKNTKYQEKNTRNQEKVRSGATRG